MPLDAGGDTASGSRLEDGRLVPYLGYDEEGGEKVVVEETTVSDGEVVREDTAKATVPPLARDLTTCLPATNFRPRA